MRFPFSDHIALLERFLSSRQPIAGALDDRLFGARGKAAARDGDRESIAAILHACFFESPAIAPHFSCLSGQLDAARLADGFEPAGPDGFARGLDPPELILRGCHYWDSVRWPGRNGRLVFVESLYALFMLQQLEQLSLRIWDDGQENAAERLQRLQHVVDVLNSGNAAHQIRLLRDARWLIQTAQGPLTSHLKPYFVTADRIARSFAGVDRVEIHKAGTVLAGGHLRSQLRHLAWQTGWGFDDPRLLALTRSSNSMDMALLVGDLVPLLDAYADACLHGDTAARLALADAILQGVSSDPELLLTRLDLLGPSTTIEDVDRGEYLSRYRELVAVTAGWLLEDSAALDPATAPYSPLGIVYGFCADLLSNMVLNTVRAAPSRLSLEDLFSSSERLEEKLALTHEWERLPKREGERSPFEYSPDWAAQMHERLTRALEARAARPVEANASGVRNSRIYVAPREVPLDSLTGGVIPAGIISAQEHCLTSDVTRARTTGATDLPADRLIADRAEGRLLACVHSDGAWSGVSKVVLTLFVSQGKDALITDVPSGVIDVLRSVCPDVLVVVPPGA